MFQFVARRVPLVVPRLAPRVAVAGPRTLFTLSARQFPAAKAASTKSDAKPKAKAPAAKRATAATKKSVAAKKPKKAPVKRKAVVKKVVKKKAVTKPKTPKVEKEFTNPPKRPLSAWLLFIKDYPIVKPITPKELTMRSKKAAADWHALSHAEKKTFLDRAAELAAEHQTASAEWKASLSKRGRRQYLASRRQAATRRALRDVETGEIIPRMLSGFNLFVQERWSDRFNAAKEQAQAKLPPGALIDSKQVFFGVVTGLGAEWRGLHPSEKAVYQAKAADLRPGLLEAREKAKAKRLENFNKTHPKMGPQMVEAASV